MDEAMEKKGLRVNAGSGTGLGLLQSSGEYPCTVCCTWGRQIQHLL